MKANKLEENKRMRNVCPEYACNFMIASALINWETLTKNAFRPTYILQTSKLS